MKQIIINDEFIFSKININKNDSLKKTIQNFSNYAYDKVKLDAIFDIEYWLKKLLEFEVFLSLTKKRHRDHLKHACRIALLGDILLREEIIVDGKKLRLLDLVRELMIANFQARAMFESYDIDINNKELIDNKILQIWFVSAIFHDIGFIYEAFMESWKNMHFLNEYPNFKQFFLDVESSIARFQNEFFISKIHNKYISCDFIRGFDHGKIGACLISNLLGESNLICDMAAVIADRHTSKEEIDFIDNPLSFLMIILDEVQEWERPVIGKKIEEKALSEKISDYSGYSESISDTSELNNVILNYEVRAVDGNKKNLVLEFILDYGNKRDILDKTSFSFPLMLYLKYKNIQRLRIEKRAKKYSGYCHALLKAGHESVPPALKSNIEEAFAKIGHCSIDDISISIIVKSSGDLADKWHRQCDILLFKSLVDRNKVISDWLCEITDYRENKGLMKFEVNKKKYLPMIFNGDYRKVILNAHEQYLRDLYMPNECWNAEFKYNKTTDAQFIEYVVNIQRKISKPKQDISIHGVYASFDEDIPDYPEFKVKVDGSDVTEKVRMVLVPKKRTSTSHNYEERVVMYIPIEPAITSVGPRQVDYSLKFKVPLKQIVERNPNYDGIVNTRKARKMQGKITVVWNKKLFDKFYKYALRYSGSEYEYSELFRRIKANKNISQCTACKGKMERNELGSDYIFVTERENLKQNHAMGFVWVSKTKINNQFAADSSIALENSVGKNP